MVARVQILPPQTAINSFTEITVNGLNTPNGVVSAYIYIGGTCTSLSYPGATSTWVTSINDAGQIVGMYANSNGVGHGFFYSWSTDARFVSFDYPGATNTLFKGINGQAQILGSYTDSTTSVGIVPNDATQHSNIEAAPIPSGRAHVPTKAQQEEGLARIPCILSVAH